MDRVTTFARSLSTAFMGLVFVLRAEQNARIHLVFAIAALILGVVLGVSDTGLVAVFFAIILVFIAEVFNTALEKTLDLIEPQHNEQVRIIKDIAAGAVLVTAIGAAAIGIVVFGPHLIGWHDQG
jgi:diacylglycerol kinase (ATP)